MNDLSRAIILATELHDGQFDLVGHPYILHPLAVMGSVAAAGFDETHQIVAVLHDVIEDCGMSAKKLTELFGPIEAGAVLALSRFPSSSETYHDFILRLRRNDIAVVVKWHDLAHNLGRLDAVRAVDPDKASRLGRRYTSAKRALVGRYTELEPAEVPT